MRICLFTTTIDKKAGGPSRSVPLLAKGLSEYGLEITLLTCQTDDMNIHILDNSSVKLEIIPPDISYNNLDRLILNGRFELIHSQNLWHPLYHKVAKIARKHKIPYMMTPRGCLEPWSLKQKKLKKEVALLLYQKTDLQKASCILATSNMEAMNIRSLGITAPITIIPNGIDIAEYECRNLQIDGVKEQICFISRIHEKKGIEFLINAWEVLRHKYPAWKIVIAGNGTDAYIARLKQLIINKELQSCIKIIPPIFGKEKYSLYCSSSLFVLPSFSENFGMVVAEAMSCGLPVITTNGTPWQVLNDKNLGWCIELSVDNLITALSSAIELGKAELYKKGLMCSDYVNRTFNYKYVARENIKVYNWIINGAEKPNTII